MREAAKRYLDAGISILPVKRTKEPAVPKWKNVTFKPEDFVGAEGIGIMCGNVSGGLECLDFDSHFGDAKKNLSELIKQIKELYDKYHFPIQSTQHGGYHLLYRCRTVGGNQKLASKPKLQNNKWRPDAIIETRGEGGYFLAAPTKGYNVIRNDILNIPTIEPEERAAIINICKSFNEWAEPVKVPEYEDKERPGDFYNKQNEAKEDMINALREAGWKQLNNYQWRRPGKNKGISATLGKVADNVFYNFTSNGHPFNAESGYTPFQVVALLKYNGNFKEFAKFIAEKYKLKSVNDYHKPQKPSEPKEKTKEELDNILAECLVDLDVVVDKPPVILSINHSSANYQNWGRLMTLGNFSVIIGKSKSKKTFFIQMLISALGNNTIDRALKFEANLPENKRQVLHFDTEQSNYDVWKAANDIHRIGGEMDNVGTFKLRDKTPKQRLEIIQHAVEYFKDNLGVLVIDGIADLVQSINSEEEANNILQKLMKWTEVYNIHVICVLHQNKGNSYATGWIGTQILKKSELVIAVETVKENPNFSEVRCDVIRGARPFEPFTFFINDDGLPEIGERDTLEMNNF